MAALIGALRVSLSAETAQFEAGMRRAQRTTQASASAMNKSLGLVKAGIAGLISGLSIGLFVNAIKGALDYAGSLGEVSQQLGVTTKDLQTFRYAAGQNGVSVEQADKGLQKLTLSMSKASAGSKPVIAAFQSVGVSLDDIKNKGAVEIFGQMADGMNKTGGASKNAAAGAVIMGREFQKFVPLANQGSAGLNQLTEAAEKLGIVLSDDQIAKADETADKLDALKTVLSAQIAGIVADNADAILGLARALEDLVGSIAGALRAWANFRAQMNAGLLELQGMDAAAARARGSAFVSDQNPTVPGRSVTIALGPAKRQRAPNTGGNPSQFLGGGGGGGKKSRSPRDDHSAERALSDAFRFDQDIRRAQQDVLQAMQNLSTDAVERYAISIQIKDLEKAAYEAELQYQVKLNELTKGQDGLTQAQAAQLKAQYDIRDSLERQKLIADENHRAFEESAQLNDLDLELQRDRLESEQGIAETAKDQRDVQLRLLDLAYRQEKAKLETILADEQSSDLAKEEARRRLANLNKTYGNDRQSVIQNTRGPMEQFTAQFSDISDELEQLKVNGIMGAADALTELTNGWGDFKNAALSAIKQVIAELIRLQIMKMIANIAGAAAGGAGGGFSGGTAGLFGSSASANLLPGGGLPPMGFATGGFVSGEGGPTADKIPAMLSNGEFVMNSGAVSSFGKPFFDAINSGRISPEDLGGKKGRGFFAGAAGMGLFGAAGLLAAGKTPPIFGVMGKVLGFSHGGFVGQGLPIPRGQRAPALAFAGGGMPGGNHFSVTVNGAMDDRSARRTGMQIALAANSEMSRARNKGLG